MSHKQTHTVSTIKIFIEFARLGLIGFGGALPFAQQSIVKRNQWLDNHEFAELLSIGQILPGGNTINIAVMLGWRLAGLNGAIAAFCGLLLVPAGLALVLAILYSKIHHHSMITHMVAGMAAAAAGLMLATGLKLVILQPKTMHSLFFIIAGCLMLACFHCSLAVALITLIPLALLSAWYQQD